MRGGRIQGVASAARMRLAHANAISSPAAWSLRSCRESAALRRRCYWRSHRDLAWHPRVMFEAGLSGRVSLVTGGSRGIGAGIARALAVQGANAVMVCVRQRSGRACTARCRNQIKRRPSRGRSGGRHRRGGRQGVAADRRKRDRPAQSSWWLALVRAMPTAYRSSLLYRKMPSPGAEPSTPTSHPHSSRSRPSCHRCANAAGVRSLPWPRRRAVSSAAPRRPMPPAAKAGLLSLTRQAAPEGRRVKAFGSMQSRRRRSSPIDLRRSPWRLAKPSRKVFR